MLDLIRSGLGSLVMGPASLTLQNSIMILAGCALLFLGIKKKVEPLLLVPIGFGAILVNIPLAGLMDHEGLFRHFYLSGLLPRSFPV